MENFCGSEFWVSFTIIFDFIFNSFPLKTTQGLGPLME